MTSQSELILEQNLISQLAANGYDKVIEQIQDSKKYKSVITTNVCVMEC